MTNIEITYDEKTWYYDALVLERWVATQNKSLDWLVKNINEAIWLSKDKSFMLKKFNFSFEDNYVNI